MKEIVLITGASGSLARKLKKTLAHSYKIRSLTTKKKDVNGKSIFYWNIKENYVDTESLDNCKHIIHLSGYSILKRWTKKNKQLMYESRVNGATLLFNKCQELNIQPSTFISASATGIYGLTANGIKTEEDQIGNDWVAKMANEWEIAADKFKKIGSRVIQMRISLLFSKKSGFLKYNIISLKYGMGVIIGSKNNIINWIHIEDAVNFIITAIKDEKYNGVFNLANQYKVSQERLIQSIKSKISPYALIIRIPISFIRFFLGDRSLILSSNINLNVEKLYKTGFTFQYNNIEDVLKD